MTTGITGGAPSAEVGTVDSFAMTIAPAGWLECNGALVSRTAYAALFAKIGTIYGAGDGATTFQIPDLRGEFVRGWDNGRGVDNGRGFATAQAGDTAPHNHINGVTAYTNGDGVGPYGSISGQPATTYHSGTSGSTGTYGMTSTTGGTETRPRNVAMLFCIKF